nr:hypothetical protein [Tanacetum cinerariifolium]
MVESEKGKAKLMIESEKGKAKLMVSDEMVEYVLAKKEKGKVDNLQNRVTKLEVDFADHDKGKVKQTELDLDDVDLDHVDLENIVKNLKEDFSRMLKENKAKEGNEADEAELKVNKDVVCFNDVKYPLTNAEIKMFKKRPTTSKAPTRQLASTSTRFRAPIASTSTFKASTRSKAPIASTSIAQAASTSAPRVYRRIAMTGYVLGLRAPSDHNARPLSTLRKRKSKP